MYTQKSLPNISRLGEFVLFVPVLTLGAGPHGSAGPHLGALILLEIQTMTNSKNRQSLWSISIKKNLSGNVYNVVLHELVNCSKTKVTKRELLFIKLNHPILRPMSSNQVSRSVTLLMRLDGQAGRFGRTYIQEERYPRSLKNDIKSH